jgi:ATP-binding cassette subfamily B (MDR/TAP) protein 9
VQEAIYNNLKGKSVILIAHRLSTVEKADKIVVINKGKVEQMGSHEQLLAQEGMYKTLVQRQMIGNGRPDEPPVAEKATDVAVGRKTSSAVGSGSHHVPVLASTNAISISPRSMAQSLLATSFTQSTTSLQSK